MINAETSTKQTKLIVSAIAPQRAPAVESDVHVAPAEENALANQH
jgi:hypothetical protein